MIQLSSKGGDSSVCIIKLLMNLLNIRVGSSTISGSALAKWSGYISDVKPKEGIEKREEKGRTRKNRGRTGDTHGQARSCVAGRMAEMG